MLISRGIIEKIGFPDKRFFISGDDTIYGLLVSRHTNIINVKDAILVRAKTSTEDQVKTPFFLYYLFRNYHLFEEYYCNLSGKTKYEATTKIKYFFSAFIYMQDAYLNNKANFYPSIKAIIRGVVDSKRKKVGSTY
jgi:GT2 family glycosyltransferase